MQELTITCTAQGNAHKIVHDSVEADGKTIHRSWTSTFDGKDYPVTGDPDADMNPAQGLIQTQSSMCLRKMGKRHGEDAAVVSKDGKTITDTGGGKDANGQAFTYSIFMEKQ